MLTKAYSNDLRLRVIAKSQQLYYFYLVKLLLTGGSSDIQNKYLCYLKLTELFEVWVDQFLVKDLQVGQVVIVDNASFRKSAKIRESIENAGCKLAFLPSYSPDLNPIEKFWANMKR